MARFDNRGGPPVLTESIMDSELQFEHHDIVEALRNLPTNKNPLGFTLEENPYADVDIQVVMIDPKVPGIPLRYSQTFIEPERSVIQGLDNIVGQPLQTISDLIIIKDKDGKIVDQLFPIFLEQVVDEVGNLVWMPADGNHRLFDTLNSEVPSPFCVVLISNVPEKYLPNYWPVDRSEVEIRPMPLEVENRRKLKKGYNALNYKENRPKFSLLGSPESKSSGEEMIDVTKHHRYVDRKITLQEDSRRQIDDLFKDKYTPLPSDSSLETKGDKQSISGCVGVTKIGGSLHMAQFSTAINGQPGENIFLTVRDKTEYLAHATRATAIVSAKEAKEINKQTNSSILDGEFFVDGKNDLLKQFGIKGSKNRQAPHLTNVETVIIPNCPQSFLVLSLDNGNQIPVQLSSGQSQLDSEKYILRDYAGRVLFVYEHFSSQGTNLLAIPTKENLPPDYQKIIEMKIKYLPMKKLFGTNSVLHSSVNVIDIEYFQPIKYHGQSDESASDTHFKYSQLLGGGVDKYTKKGMFYDLKTAAIACISQLQSGYMFLPKNIPDSSVLLEKVFCQKKLNTVCSSMFIFQDQILK